MSKLYKVFHNDGLDGWPLPGAWLEVKDGLHLYRAQDLVGWLGPSIFEAEYEGELIVHCSKVVVRRARLIRRLETWNERTARLFAADCAERALPIFEGEYPHDPRPRKAIEAARAYARGEIDGAAKTAAWEAAKTAAEDAKKAAAWEAARTAAWAAAWAAANGAAWAAARDAAWNAAWAAAWNTAWAAERKWQTARLFQYLEGR